MRRISFSFLLVALISMLWAAYAEDAPTVSGSNSRELLEDYEAKKANLDLQKAGLSGEDAHQILHGDGGGTAVDMDNLDKMPKLPMKYFSEPAEGAKKYTAKNGQKGRVWKQNDSTTHSILLTNKREGVLYTYSKPAGQEEYCSGYCVVVSAKRARKYYDNIPDDADWVVHGLYVKETPQEQKLIKANLEGGLAHGECLFYKKDGKVNNRMTGKYVKGQKIAGLTPAQITAVENR